MTKLKWQANGITSTDASTRHSVNAMGREGGRGEGEGRERGGRGEEQGTSSKNR